MSIEEEQRELDEELSRALKALTEAVVKQTIAERDQKQARTKLSFFPFSALEQLLDRGLLALERMVRRVVAAIVR